MERGTKEMKPKYKIVEVEWLDAQSGFGNAQYVEDLCLVDLKPENMRYSFSVGYLLHNDKDKIILGFMLFGEDMVKHNQMIPKTLIKKMRYLKCRQ